MQPEQTQAEAMEQRLEAELMEPAPSPQVAPPSSNLSEMSAMRDLLGTLVQRVDQVARTSAEQFSRVESTLATMEATMQLAREMIGQMDDQYQKMTDLVERLETGLAALARVNANLTEIVAALLAPPPQKG